MTTLIGLKIDPRPPRCIKTHYEIRCIQNGRATPLHDGAETLNEARERATDKAKALHHESYFELEKGQEFADHEADGVYLCTIKTESTRSRLDEIVAGQISNDLGLYEP